ncbi:MAG: hypothetical protein H6662_14085 [Ardenticatenaceae bacterium]|nr:hypothetical protein [Ardenticatenaceae bacterium]
MTTSVNGDPFVSGWTDLRTRYWGFGETEMPRNGCLVSRWLRPFPLLLMVHGNHDMADYSDGGYAYLGELLASRGFIFVSVDENFLNSSAVADWLGEKRLSSETTLAAGCCWSICACGVIGTATQATPLPACDLEQYRLARSFTRRGGGGGGCGVQWLVPLPGQCPRAV